MNPITGIFAALSRLRTSIDRLAASFDGLADETEKRIAGEEDDVPELESGNGHKRLARSTKA